MNQIRKISALPILSSASFARSDSGHRRDSNELFTSFDQELRDDGGDGAGEGPVSGRHGAGTLIEGEAQLVSEAVTRQPKDQPGFAMAQQLAGDGKTDEALGRLLEDLDDMHSAPSENESPQDLVPPVAPFAHSANTGGPFHHAASAYEWGAKALNSKDPLKPGVIYSEQF